ncbi:hypothetical protein ASC77_08645 [Nocardioides sp. Root1257]|nr:hypothetical protein ASC77_08645 [Nocardioides sp. Root1257]KRC48628.1 hypothetical protein ASE24_08650 [Nocardioides sp. Root224]
MTLIAVLAGTAVRGVAAEPRGVPPVNRYAGPVGTATMHGDAGSSDTTPYAGPGADPATPVTIALGGVCPTVLAGADALPQALCTGYLDRAPTLHLLDPETSVPLASLTLEKGSLLGGVYAYVDHRDRLVTVDGSGAILLIAHDQQGPGGSWRLFVQRRIPVRATITTVAPGYDGRIWFATAHGRAGYADPRTKDVRMTTLGHQAEIVANSISTAPEGTSVVTDRATYLLTTGPRGGVQVAWRRAYDRGPARKPGQLSHGSGATPTFFGPRTGHEYVAITDNARPREHLVVYRTDTGRTVCSAPIFGADNSGTENSTVGWRNQVYVASTYGYPYPATPDGAGAADPATADFVGGMQRFRVGPRGCRLVWSRPTRSAAVPRLSTGEHVLYTVTRSTSQVYRLARISPRTGAVLSETLLGAGPLSDTLQMVGTILPDGTLLQGSIGGLSAVHPDDP